MAATLRVWISVGEPDLTNPETCPDCGFDSVVRLPVTAITEQGVSDWSNVRVCARCWDEQHGDDECA